jgi:ring-1,2-phenylacetyl-CoA epoxidase subunit PaaD
MATTTDPGRSALERRVWEALGEVPDPEIPVVSVIELGIIRSVEAAPERIRVEMLPTFVGCPALEMIRQSIADRLAGMAAEVQVEASFAPTLCRAIHWCNHCRQPFEQFKTI